LKCNDPGQAARLAHVRARRAAAGGDAIRQAQFEQVAAQHEAALGLPPRRTTPPTAPLESVPSSGPVMPPVPTAEPTGPLLPVHPGVTLELGSRGADGLELTARYGTTPPRTWPVGPGFLQELGLDRHPTPTDALVSVPMLPLMGFAEGWTGLAHQMADVLRVPEILGALSEASRDAGNPVDLRLAVVDPVLSQFPWEFAAYLARGVGRFPEPSLVRHVVRVPGPEGDRVTLRWVQTVLRQMIDRGLPLEGGDSPRLRDAIRAFQARAGLPITGQADAQTRRALDHAWRAEQGRLAGAVLVIPDPNSPSSLQGQWASPWWESIYRDLGLEMLVLPRSAESPADFARKHQDVPLRVIHVGAPLLVASSVGVTLDPGPAGSRVAVPITPKQLDEMLRALPEGDSKPHVVFAPPAPTAPFEAIRQLVLRNAFAAALYRLGNAPVVVATGLLRGAGPPELVRALVESAGAGATVGDLLGTIRTRLPGGPAEKIPIEDLLFPVGTALFTSDPDTRLAGGTPSAPLRVEEQPTGTAPIVTRTLHALLVGINEYADPTYKLAGCVNDVRHVRSFLEQGVGRSQGIGLELCVLTDREATRGAVLEALRGLHAKARPGNTILFYFAGRGTEAPVPGLSHAEGPTPLVDALVMHDTYLAEKELFRLLDEPIRRGARVTIILDSCYSGSLTRDVLTDESAVRRTLATPEFLARVEGLIRPPEAVIPAATDTDSLRPILLRATREGESAKEITIEGERRGAFSAALLQALRATGVPTYRSLFERTSALVRAWVSDQSPVLEAAPDDVDAVFLDGALPPVPSTYLVRYAEGRWTLDAGWAFGIPAPHGRDAARLALFPFDAPAAALADPAKAAAMATVVEVDIRSSRLAIEGDAALDPGTAYRAVIVSLPLPRRPVELTGDPDACDQARALLREGGAAHPGFLREAAPDEAAEFRLQARGGEFRITSPNDDRPLVEPTHGLDDAAARNAVERLAHIARWMDTAQLANPVSSIRPDEIELAIEVEGKIVSGREIRLEYRDVDGKPVPPSFRISLTNNGSRILYCSLLDLTQHFGVSVVLTREGCVRIAPGQTVWANGGKPIVASIPDDIWVRGVIEYRDRLKLIVATREFDARLLAMPDVDQARSVPGGIRGTVRDGSLNRQFLKVQTRDIETF
jgi:hypothetical protein